MLDDVLRFALFAPIPRHDGGIDFDELVVHRVVLFLVATA
jgi:hypothetical protein